MTACRHVVLICTVFWAGIPSVWAQEKNQFALGWNGTHRLASDSDLHHVHSQGPTWRIGHDKEGWGWQWGLNWYTTNIDRTIDGGRVDLGNLRVRPFMGGYGYTHLMGRTSVTVDALGGYAINSVKLTDAATIAYRDRLGALDLRGDASNTLVARPEVNIWYDLTRKIGVKVNAGYLIARPRVTVQSTMGNDSRRVKADVLGITVGAVYSIR